MNASNTAVAFHNADLDREERQAVETTFRDSQSSLKVLVATTTLAMGVNTPAWSVVIAGLEHPDSPYSVAEYKNMVGRFRLTELGKVSGELGISVESVVRIARALRGLPGSQLTEAALLAAAQTSVELDDVLLPVHRKSVKERQRWRGTIQQQHLPHSVRRELFATYDATATTRCKKLSAVLMWLEGVELNRLEASLLVHLPGNAAAGSIRAVADRTRDLIGVVARIGALVSADGTASQHLSKNR